MEFYPLAPLSKGTYGSRLDIKHYNNQYYRSALPKHSYLRLEPFYMPFEMLVPLMETREKWECTWVGRGGREFGYWYDVEEQLELKSDSWKKLMKRISAIETAAKNARGAELEQELAMLEIWAKAGENQSTMTDIGGWASRSRRLSNRKTIDGRNLIDHPSRDANGHMVVVRNLPDKVHDVRFVTAHLSHPKFIGKSQKY